MILKFLFAVVVVLALYTGWHGVEIHQAYGDLRTAPQGQFIGPADAKVTIVELMDYRCHPCRAMSSVIQDVARKHPDVRIVFRHLPVYGVPSVHEARLALAAGKQGRFNALHDILITRSEPLKDSDLPEICTQAGLDCERLQKDAKDADITRTLLSTVDDATLLNVKSDPSFLIGHTIFSTQDRMPVAADFDALIAHAQKH